MNLRQIRTWLKEAAIVVLLFQLGFCSAQTSITDNKSFEMSTRANAAFEQARNNEAFTTLLEGKEVQSLPIIIPKTIGNRDYSLCMDSIVVTPAFAYAVMYAEIEAPRSGQNMIFGATNIRFTKDGGFSGDVKLQLLGNFSISFGPNIKITFLSDSVHQTYVEFDCNGYKQMHLDGQVEFSRNIMLPENLDGTIAEGTIQSDFSIDLVDFDNLFLSIDVDQPFQIPGADGVSFSVRDMTFDYSDYTNKAGMIFPKGYDSPDFMGEDKNYWRGFYMSEASVSLPSRFKTKTMKTGERITFGVRNLLIDKMGFSGHAFVQNLFDLSNGDMSGWDYSLEQIELHFMKNTMTGAGFNGQLKIPITGKQESFRYTATIKPGDQYELNIETAGKIDFPLWGAGNVQLDPESFVQVGVYENKFLPRAELNGQMDISASIGAKKGENIADKGKSLNLVEIKFRKLNVKTTEPHVFIGAGGGVGVGSPRGRQLLSELPITVRNVEFVSHHTGLMGIKATLKVNLTGKNDDGGVLSGDATGYIWGSKSEREYIYDHTWLSEIGLNGKIANMDFTGRIKFYKDDLIYGNGFAGNLILKLDKPNISVTANAVFGKKDKLNSNGIFRYWYVDALAEFDKPIPVAAPAMYLNALGGGAYYRMKMDDKPNPSSIGQTASGVTYSPKEDYGLGIKFLCGIQGQAKQVYNGRVNFEIVFRKGGGLANMYFSGYVAIATKGNFNNLRRLQDGLDNFKSASARLGPFDLLKPSAPAKPQEVNAVMSSSGAEGAIVAEWMMQMDFVQGIFSCKVDLFVKVAGGIVKGINGYNHAGSVDILIQNKNNWHIYLGVPNQPLGINILNIVKISAYVVMGSYIPPPQPLPDGVPSSSSLDFSKLNTGGGFGFGARFWVGLGNRDGTPFYAYAGVDVGFDVMMLNIKGKRCRETGREFGINNWFAIGQIYVMVQVGAGLRTCMNLPKLVCWKFWKPKCWEMERVCANAGLNLGFGVSVQVTAPNPTFIAVPFRAFGKNRELRLGKPCTF